MFVFLHLVTSPSQGSTGKPDNNSHSRIINCLGSPTNPRGEDASCTSVFNVGTTVLSWEEVDSPLPAGNELPPQMEDSEYLWILSASGGVERSTRLTGELYLVDRSICRGEGEAEPKGAAVDLPADL